MALADTQLYQLASFDPYTQFQKGPLERKQFELEKSAIDEEYQQEMQRQKQLQSSPLSSFSGTIGSPTQTQQTPDLSKMTKSIFGTSDVQLERPDGTQTEAGRISEMFGTKIQEQQRAQQLDAQSAQIMQKAKQFRFSDPSKFAQLSDQAGKLSEAARRADIAATTAGDKLQEKWNDVLTGGLLSIATANPGNYKEALQNWQEQTGIPIPSYVPKQYDKEAISKFLKNPQIPQKVRTAVETELDKEATRIHNQKMRPLLENKAVLDVRDKLLDIEKKKEDFEGGGKFNAQISTLQQDIGTGYKRLDDLIANAKPGEIPGASNAFGRFMKGDGILAAAEAASVKGMVPPGLKKNDAILLGLAFDIASARGGGRGQLSDTKIREVQQMMPLATDDQATRSYKISLIENALDEANKSLPPKYRKNKEDIMKQTGGFDESKFKKLGGGAVQNSGGLSEEDTNLINKYSNPKAE